jgi:hypothetical protein
MSTDDRRPYCRDCETEVEVYATGGTGYITIHHATVVIEGACLDEDGCLEDYSNQYFEDWDISEQEVEDWNELLCVNCGGSNLTNVANAEQEEGPKTVGGETLNIGDYVTTPVMPRVVIQDGEERRNAHGYGIVEEIEDGELGVRWYGEFAFTRENIQFEVLDEVGEDDIEDVTKEQADHVNCFEAYIDPTDLFRIPDLLKEHARPDRDCSLVSLTRIKGAAKL